MKVTNYARLALAFVLPLAASTGYADFGIPGVSSSAVNGVTGISSPNFANSNEVITVEKFGSGAANSYWKISGTGSAGVFDSFNKSGL